MPEVLIAGCGYVGSVAAELFSAAGWKVTGWTRSGVAASGCESHAVDLSEAASVRKVSGSFDVVIHCASTKGGKADDYRRVDLEGARNLRDRFSEARLIF